MSSLRVPEHGERPGPARRARVRGVRAARGRVSSRQRTELHLRPARTADALAIGRTAEAYAAHGGPVTRATEANTGAIQEFVDTAGAGGGVAGGDARRGS
ncbi:hypothetical protein RSA28_06155 [Rothia kristinae]|nr:hypothetical protein RSA28_06155 [Rothia kristinae]